MNTPFKLRSGNKPSMARLSGSSPNKSTDPVSQKVTEGFSKNQHNYGKTTKVTTTKNGITSFIEKSNKTGATVSSGGGSNDIKKLFKPNMTKTGGFDPTKTMKPGVKGYENFQKVIKNSSKNTSNSSKLSKLTKTGKSLLGKVGKFLGGKTLGVAGMMMGTIGTADANPHSNIGTYDRKSNTYK